MSDKSKTSCWLVTRHSSLVTALLIVIRFRRRGLFVGDPGDEEAQPVLRRLANLHADARRAVDGRSDAHDRRRDFDGRAVGPVRAQVQALAAINFLIEMKEYAGG